MNGPSNKPQGEAKYARLIPVAVAIGAALGVTLLVLGYVLKGLVVLLLAYGARMAGAKQAKSDNGSDDRRGTGHDD